MDDEIVIGLEVHVQLATASKLFCSCPNAFSLDPNTQICPVCLGQPGVLPVLNEEAFHLALRAALALGCEIPPVTKFDRKHYYYPDLPKNIQISQYDMPLSRNGALAVDVNGTEKRVSILRAHLEEDAGKLLHDGAGSAVDLNRTGTPLLEIVSGPDLRSPAEARAYLEQLKLTLQYVEVSDCNMEEGSLRCDANISIRPAGATELGVKNEIKNMNSFKGTESALGLVAEELRRAKATGETIRQTTWGYSVERDAVFPMRVKEEANDYRYFPEPDLPPVRVSREWVEETRRNLPELPRARQQRLQEQFDLSVYDAHGLVQDRTLADYFEAVAACVDRPKAAANWILNDVVREMRERGWADVADFPVAPAALGELIALAEDGAVNRPTAKKLLTRLIEGEVDSARATVEREGLGQVADRAALADLLEGVIREHPTQTAELEGGKHTTAMWFVGQIMRATQGQADPQTVQAVVAERFHIDPALLQKRKKQGKKD